MKKLNTSILAKLVAVATVAFAGTTLLDVGPAAAAGSANSNLTVSASVSANCIISTSPVAFGAYDPVSANASAALNASGSVIVTCTNGSSGTITLGQGSNSATGSTDGAPLRQMSDGSGVNVLSYGLFSDTTRLVTWGNTPETGVVHNGTGISTSISVYGKMVGGQNMPAGSYSDTVVATISF